MHRFSLLLGERVLEQYVFDKDRLSVGRHEHADICIANRAVSRQHARIELRGQQCRIVDLGATNGIVFEGEPVASQVMAPGAIVYLGKFGIRYDGFAPMSAADRSVRNTEKLVGARASHASRDQGPIDPVDFEESTVAVQFKGDARRLLGLKGEPLPGQAYFAIAYDDGNEENVNLAGGSVSFGKSSEADIRLHGFWMPSLLGRVIYRRDRGAVLQCAHRRPKVRVNGQPCMRAELRDGDEISIGSTVIRVRLG